MEVSSQDAPVPQRAFGAPGDLVPGCNGGNGGNAGGLGGAGGGAIQITAGYGIFVSGGAIFANGIGGRGGVRQLRRGCPTTVTTTVVAGGDNRRFRAAR